MNADEIIFRELVEVVNEWNEDSAIALFRQFIKVAQFPFKSNYGDGYRVIKINDSELLVFRSVDYEETALEVWADKSGFFLYKTDMESLISMYFEKNPWAMAKIYDEGRFYREMKRILPRDDSG